MHIVCIIRLELIIKHYLKRCLAQTMQWIGSEGVLRIVHPGNVFCAGLGWHS